MEVLQIEWDGYTFMHIYTYIPAYTHTNVKRQHNMIICLAAQLGNYIEETSKAKYLVGTGIIGLLFLL